MITLSDNFDWDEVSHSQTAQRLGIDNTVPIELEPAVRNTARNMERVRALLQAPVVVSSWYRSSALNASISGSSRTSQHMRGEAVDFISPRFGTPFNICARILKYPELVSFDQLILEHTWVHISFSSDPTVKNRRQVLSLLESGSYAAGLTDRKGRPL
jgi:putative chitinase